MNRSGIGARNIKKLILIIAVFLSGLLIGCTNDVSMAGNRFDMEYIQSDLINWVGEFYLYRDNQTGVHYLVFKEGDSIAITPRYNSDGTLYK